MKIAFNEFQVKKCTENDFDKIIELQNVVISQLESCILRQNTEKMFHECLEAPNVTIGVWHNCELVAFSVLYFPKTIEEDLAHSLKSIDASSLKSVNYKLCIVKKEYRGNSLQHEMGKILLPYAVENNAEIICATVSPNNPYSINNIRKLGFVYDSSQIKYEDVERNLYYKLI